MNSTYMGYKGETKSTRGVCSSSSVLVIRLSTLFLKKFVFTVFHCFHCFSLFPPRLYSIFQQILSFKGHKSLKRSFIVTNILISCSFALIFYITINVI